MKPSQLPFFLFALISLSAVADFDKKPIQLKQILERCLRTEGGKLVKVEKHGCGYSLDLSQGVGDPAHGFQVAAVNVNWDYAFLIRMRYDHDFSKHIFYDIVDTNGQLFYSQSFLVDEIIGFFDGLGAAMGVDIPGFKPVGMRAGVED
ncbi:MAG: hypothetical protein V4534_06650 [Myxococcota bacterium]